MTPSIARLRALLVLHADGTLTWRATGRKAGGASAKGYLRLSIDGKRLLAHRVVWALTTGAWPAQPIDHVNGRRTDNRPSNLRLASPSDNQCNRGAQRNSATGFKGVSLDARRQKFRASICKDGRRRFLGHFATAEAAGHAYEAAASVVHGAFATREARRA